jgi:vitamin K-dependent gamma-carboxylase
MNRFLFAPVNSSSLAAYRILFAALNAIGLIRFWHLGWIERSFIQPQFLFKYYGFEWVQLWPGQGIYIHFAALIAVCICLGLGLFTRVMSVLFFLGFTYIELLDQSNYLNHYYLISLLGFIGVFLPLNARWSLDNLFGLSQRREWVPAWTLNWLRLQVGTVYVFAGIAKIGSDWLLHAQPLNIWLTSSVDMPVLGPLFGQGWIHYAMSWAGFLFDISIPFWMCIRRTRPFAYAAIVFFHAMTYLLFPIGMFPFIMTFSALVFFESDWPLRLIKRIRPYALPEICNIKFQPRFQSAVMLALALWFCVQWTLPFRHLLYPGEVLWNEEGMRFSWKVMIREKNGEAVFRVVDRASGETWYVSASEYLLRHQETEMSGTPDMLLQFARHLKDEFALEGIDVAVYADTKSSFNGRTAVPLVDPKVDLAMESDSLQPKKWILPAPQSAPHQLTKLHTQFFGAK